jgi:hypothetical protein
MVHFQMERMTQWLGFRLEEYKPEAGFRFVGQDPTQRGGGIDVSRGMYIC